MVSVNKQGKGVTANGLNCYLLVLKLGLNQYWIQLKATWASLYYIRTVPLPCQ